MIHTDFERGFIRAQTIAYDDFVSNTKAKRARKKRVKCAPRVKTMWSKMVTY